MYGSLGASGHGGDFTGLDLLEAVDETALAHIGQPHHPHGDAQGVTAGVVLHELHQHIRAHGEGRAQGLLAQMLHSGGSRGKGDII